MESAKPAVVETLLGFGADLHIQGGKLKETPLHLGSRVPDGDRCVLMLLKSGANPNIITENGETPVHVASRYGNVVTLDLLLDDMGDPLLKSHVISSKVFFLQEGINLIFFHFPIGWRHATSFSMSKLPPYNCSSPY